MSFESKPTGLLKTEKKTKKTRKSTDTFPDAHVHGPFIFTWYRSVLGADLGLCIGPCIAYDGFLCYPGKHDVSHSWLRSAKVGNENSITRPSLGLVLVICSVRGRNYKDTHRTKHTDMQIRTFVSLDF
jgi:hypothetical protein